METIRALSLPPGFGFHPTDVELVSHYLKRKILGLKIDFEVIPELDMYKYEPWDLPAKCHIPTSDSKWHFFTSRDRKYPSGSRLNRTTEAGYWKSTGKDRNIRLHNQVIGIKKTLVFHEGRPPCGKRTDWIMHEYSMDENECKAAPGMKGIFVLCRVTKRNDLAFDSEYASPKTKEIDTCPNPLKDVALSVVQEESSRPSENVEDFDSWFTELYDPDFCAIPTIGVLKSEPKEDFSSLALKQEPIDFIPKFSEGIHLLQSGDDSFSILKSDIHDFDYGAFGDFDIESTDAASSTQFNARSTHNDLSPAISMGGYIDNRDSSFIDRNDNKSAAFDPTGSTQPNDNNDAVIQLRERYARPIDIPSYRLKLKVHKMERKNCGSVNQTIKFVNQDHHLDLNDGRQDHARIEVEEKQSPWGSTYSEGSQSDPSCRSASKTRQILMSQAPNLRKRSTAGPLTVGRFSSTNPDDMSCIQGLIRGLCMFQRRCSSGDLNCVFLGVCMVVTAAVTLYFLLRDARGVISSFSAVGV